MNSEISSVKLPDSITGIGNDAFRGCNQLTEFVFPKNMKSIDCSVFHGCESLRKVILPGGSSEIHFYGFGCPNLEEIVFDGEHDIYYSEGQYLYHKDPVYNSRYNVKTDSWESFKD